MKKNRREQRRLQSIRHGCKCPECVECCERDPGWFMPDEVAIAAQYLGLNENEFIEKYCTEHIYDGTRTLSPAMKNGGSSCIFLNRDKECSIHEVKPFECKKVYGCGANHRHKRLREMISKNWKK
ncbi:MAG: Flagellin N-methylase [bacterium ADurb.Bin270]|nr:MAG: Flagellin N-methylase [bacterium ADurb.Bin270]